MTCSGETSCKWIEAENVQSFTCSYGGSVSWDGHIPCYQSRIIGGPGSKVFAESEKSMKKSKIQAAYVYGSGKQSLVEANINPAKAGKDTMLDVVLTGENAGQDLQINCPSGATCTVTCQGNACQGTKLTCAPGATCKVYPEVCIV